MAAERRGGKAQSSSVQQLRSAIGAGSSSGRQLRGASMQQEAACSGAFMRISAP